jgi:hypothetical protein
MDIADRLLIVARRICATYPDDAAVLETGAREVRRLEKTVSQIVEDARADARGQWAVKAQAREALARACKEHTKDNAT